MALTKDDLAAIRSIVREGNDELARLVNESFQYQQDTLHSIESRMILEFRQVNRSLEVLDIFRLGDFRDLVRMLTDKKVLTAEEAARFHVQPDRPAA